MRVTVEIPEALHTRLRARASRMGVSIRSRIVDALELTCREDKAMSQGCFVTGPMLKLGGKSGPRFPVDENPHDLILD